MWQCVVISDITQFTQSWIEWWSHSCRICKFRRQLVSIRTFRYYSRNANLCIEDDVFRREQDEIVSEEMNHKSNIQFRAAGYQYERLEQSCVEIHKCKIPLGWADWIRDAYRVLKALSREKYVILLPRNVSEWRNALTELCTMQRPLLAISSKTGNV